MGLGICGGRRSKTKNTGIEEGVSNVRGQLESGRRQGRSQGRYAMYVGQVEMESRVMGEDERGERVDDNTLTPTHSLRAALTSRTCVGGGAQ